MKKKSILTCLIALTMSLGASAQKFSLGVNVFDLANFGTPNLEAGLAVSRNFSIHAGARYNKWTFGAKSDDPIQNRKRTAWLGCRYWPWNTYSGLWFQFKAQYNEINSNILTKKYTDPETLDIYRRKIEGEAIGGGLGVGYDVMLSKHWNLEVGASVWAGSWLRYNTYAKNVGGRILPGECYTNKFFVLPDDVHVTFIYVF